MSFLRLILKSLGQFEDVEVVLEPIEAFAQLLHVKYASDVTVLALVKLKFEVLHLISCHFGKLSVGLSLLFKLHEDHLFVHLIHLFISDLDLFFNGFLFVQGSLKLMLQLDYFHVLLVYLGSSVFEQLFGLGIVSRSCFTNFLLCLFTFLLACSSDSDIICS